MDTQDHHPEPIIISPAAGKHHHTLILLHGTSSSGSEFAPQILDFPFTLTPPHPSSPLSSSTSTLKSKEQQIRTTLRKQFAPGGRLEGIKLVIPTGSLKKLTCKDGMEGNAWFDMVTFRDRTVGERGQIEGMSESLRYLRGLVERERGVLDLLNLKGYGGEIKMETGRRKGKGKLILAGFSQGCAMGAVGVLSGELEVDGFVGMSGWLPFRRQVDEILSSDSDSREINDPESQKGDLSPWKKVGSLGLLLRHILRFLKKGWSMLRILVTRLMNVFLFGGISKSSAREDNPVAKYYRHLLSLPQRQVDIKKDVPILLGHGTADIKVRYEWGLQMRETIKNTGFKNMETRNYEGLEHGWNEDELRDLVIFLKNICQ